MSTKRTTPFRANEAEIAGRDEAIHKYTRSLKDSREREAAISYIDSLIATYGPVVRGYPSWHPFTASPKDQISAAFDAHTTPQGFRGLDHTIYLRDAFVTAPYSDDEADEVIASTNEKMNPYIVAEKIDDVVLYAPGAKPVLVWCDGLDKEDDGTISKRFALGRMLAHELPAWEQAECGESWETMRHYFLGTPCGSRSSLLVNQDTGLALKEVWNLLNRHELFGPVYRGS